MELRRYWNVVSSRWWLVVLPVVAAVVLGGIWTIRQASSFTASTRLVVSHVPAPVSQFYYGFDEYYNWQSSEYIIDDYTQILKSKAFAGDVIKRLSINPKPSDGQIAGALSVSRQNRVLTIGVSWPDATQAKDIANAAADTLVENRTKYYGRPGTEDVAVNVIDYADGAAGNSSRRIFNLGLALVLGLVVGVVLAFITHYLDDSVKNADDAAAILGVPVLGEIPRQVEKRRIRSHQASML